MRKSAVGISFKIYKNKQTEIKTYLEEMIPLCENIDTADLFVFPSMGTLAIASGLLKDSTLHYGSQNIAPIANGALTGEFSIESLLDLEGDYVELGHAERRKYFNETDDMIHQKVKLALENQVTPVLCIGENEAQKTELRKHLHTQLKKALADISPVLLKNVILAYEPIWAIGQAEAASANYVHQAHQVIREELQELFGVEVAEAIRIIYGGSVSKENTPSIVSDENVDGVFVGRFGHESQNFKAIIDAVLKVKSEGK